MKRLLLIVCTIIINVAVLAQSQTSAPAPTQYALLEYIKIEPGKAADYRKLEQEVWVPIHHERVKMGAIKSWSAWGVRFPGGASREYDRVIITTFNKFADVETPYPPSLFAKVFPNTLATELVVRTQALSKIVRSELVALIDSTSLNPQPLPPFAEINFHKLEPGKGPEYTELIRKYWKPLHEERVKRGILKGWLRYGVRYPQGTEREYGQISLSFFEKFEHLETQYPPDLLAKVLPGVNVADVVAQSNATRKTVRTQLLMLVDQVH